MSLSLSRKMGLPGYTPANILYHFGPEIRNIIYDNVYHSDWSNQGSLTLMRVSKQLHLEAGSHFYANNTFVLQVPSPALPGATVLPTINDRYLPFLKCVGIEIDAGCAARPRVQEIATVISNLTKTGAQFETLHFLIQFPPELSSFLRTRFDDSILDKAHPITIALYKLLDSGVSKMVHIIMNGAWFATGVAGEMKDRYNSRLKFMQINEEGKLVGLNDPAQYEMPLVGCCSCTPCGIFGLNTGDDSEDLSSATGLDLYAVECVLDLETSNSEPLFDGDKTLEIEIEEDLNDEDDVDMDNDLISLDDGEADAIAKNWNYTSSLLADESQMRTEIEFLVTMAPQLLTLPSRLS